jgi:hypothetical protein
MSAPFISSAVPCTPAERVSHVRRRARFYLCLSDQEIFYPPARIANISTVMLPAPGNTRAAADGARKYAAPRDA